MTKISYKSSRKYKCPYCEKRDTRDKLVDHINRTHVECIPEEYTAARAIYDHINGKNYNTCMICKERVYKWNEKINRYCNLCDKPECRAKVREIALQRHMKVYNKPTLLNDPEHQEKMLANRKISGKYKFSDGGVVTYTGKYEKNALEFMDTVLNIPSTDIQCPGPTFAYDYKGEKHTWITDIYYIPANLVIEIKDGGDNPNNRSMPEYRAKQVAKEKMITDLGTFNYIRLTNNDFAQLLDIFADMKNEALENPNPGVKIHINESQEILQEKFIINEKDIYYNKDKFDSGEINLCFIIGQSGSGKTTMAYDEKDKLGNIEVYMLDYITYNWLYKDIDLSNNNLVSNFFKKYPEFRYRTRKDWENDLTWQKESSPNYYITITRKFIDFVVQYAESYRNKKYIIEGVQLLYAVDPEDLKEYAVYIKGTSLLLSKFRAAKRNYDKYEDSFIKSIFDIKNYKYRIRTEELISKFRDYFRNFSLKEEVGSLPMNKPSQAYVIPYGMNDVFAGLGFSDMSSDKITYIDDDNFVKIMNKKEFEKKYEVGPILLYQPRVNISKRLRIVDQAINEKIKVDSNLFIAETVLGYQMSTWNDILLSEDLRIYDEKREESLGSLFMNFFNEISCEADSINKIDEYGPVSIHITPKGYCAICNEKGCLPMRSNYHTKVSDILEEVKLMNEIYNEYIVEKEEN